MVEMTCTFERDAALAVLGPSGKLDAKFPQNLRGSEHCIMGFHLVNGRFGKSWTYFKGFLASA